MGLHGRPRTLDVHARWRTQEGNPCVSFRKFLEGTGYSPSCAGTGDFRETPVKSAWLHQHAQPLQCCCCCWPSSCRPWHRGITKHPLDATSLCRYVNVAIVRNARVLGPQPGRLHHQRHLDRSDRLCRPHTRLTESSLCVLCCTHADERHCTSRMLVLR